MSQPLCEQAISEHSSYGFNGGQMTIFGTNMMLADGEITPMRLRGKLVRFYLPDVLQELREKAKTSKRNVARRV